MMVVAGCRSSDRVSVSGQVTRQDGSPVVGSRVIFRSTTTGDWASGVTDADGDGALDAPTNAENALGLIAKDVKVSHKLTDFRVDGWALSHPEDNPLYIYASVIGGLSGDDGDGIFGLEEFPNGLDPLDPILGNGFRYQFGSQIVVQATAWARVQNTLPVAGLGSGQTIHDSAAALSPPPYFPAAPTFLVKSYEDNFVGNDGAL